jgi:teichuronic acid exporter
VVWSSLQVFVNRSFGFVIKLVLARILAPTEFGLVGMAVVFTSFVEVLNDLGIAAALVQRKEEKLTEKHFHTAFWTGVAWSIVTYFVMVFLVAPFAVNFYTEPLLGKIIPVLSLGILSSPVNLVHRAQLTRKMDFKKLAFINNFSSIFSGILSLILAFLGAGVWSLVFNSIATFIIAMPMYFNATKWRPKIIWDKDAFKDVFGFGVYTTGTNLFNNLMNKLDYLLIGKLVSAAALGNYTLAFVLTDTFRSQVMGIINKVMYPVYGRVQDDKQALKKFYIMVVKFNSLLIFPVMWIFILEGEGIILTFFGEKWIDTIVPLQILSGSILFHMMVNSNTMVIRGMGKPKLELQLQFFKSVFLYVPVLSVMIYHYGILGAAWAFFIIKFISIFIVQYYLKKLIDYTFTDLFEAMREVVLVSLIAVLAVLGIKSLINLNFAINATLFMAIYGGCIYFLMEKELSDMIKNFKSKKIVF